LDRNPTTLAFMKTALFWPKAKFNRFVHANSKKIRDKYKVDMEETRLIIWKNIQGQMVGIFNGVFRDWTEATALIEESSRVIYEPLSLMHVKSILTDPDFKLVVFFTGSNQSQVYKAYEKFAKSNIVIYSQKTKI
jgi:hypothetical protein